MFVSSQCKTRLTNVMGGGSFYFPVNATYQTVEEIAKSIILYVVKTNFAVIRQRF
jgi:hypothetical protein